MKTYEYGGFNSDFEKDINKLYDRALNITEDNISSIDDAKFSVTNVKFSDVSTVNSTPMFWVNKLIQFFKVNKMEHLTKKYETPAFTVGKGVVDANVDVSDNARTKIVFQVPEGYDGRQAMVKSPNFKGQYDDNIGMSSTVTYSMLEDNCRGGVVFTYNKDEIVIEFIHESCKYSVPEVTWYVNYWRNI